MYKGFPQFFYIIVSGNRAGFLAKPAPAQGKTQHLVPPGRKKNIADFLLTVGKNQGIITRSVILRAFD